MLELSFCFKRADLYLGFSQRLCWRILSIFVQELSSRPKGFLNVLKIGELRAKFMGFAFFLDQGQATIEFESFGSSSM